jgi:hypothetical protein
LTLVDQHDDRQKVNAFGIMLENATRLFSISRRFHLYRFWIGFLLVAVVAILSPDVYAFSHKRYYANAFLLTPPSSTRQRHHHINGLLFPSLFSITSVSSSSTLTAPILRKPTSAGRGSSSLNAAQRSSSNDHQNRRLQSRPPQQSRQQFLTVTNVLDDYVKNRDNIKPYQVGLVWNKLGKAVQQSRNKREQRNFWAGNETNLRTLTVHTTQSVDEFNGQSTATVTHSLAKLSSLSDSNLNRVQSLWNALLLRTAMQLKSDGFNAQDVSNLLWAYAKVDKGQTRPRAHACWMLWQAQQCFGWKTLVRKGWRMLHGHMLR